MWTSIFFNRCSKWDAVLCSLTDQCRVSKPSILYNYSIMIGFQINHRSCYESCYDWWITNHNRIMVMEYALGFVTIQRQILWLTDAQALRQRWWSDLMWPRVNIPPYPCPCPYPYSWQGPPTPPHVMCSRIIAPISSYQPCIAPLPSLLVHHDSSYNACQNNPTIYKPISW